MAPFTTSTPFDILGLVGASEPFHVLLLSVSLFLLSSVIRRRPWTTVASQSARRRLAAAGRLALTSVTPNTSGHLAS